MPIIAGADGCKGGWICITQDIATGEKCARLYETASQLILQRPIPEILAIDIPIGLPDTGTRKCDLEARQYLGKRHVCVFSAPIRSALAASSADEASRITRQRDGRGVTRQAWGIFGKIKEVDEVLVKYLEARNRVIEVHPELSFSEWNGLPFGEGKKSAAGKAARQTLIGKAIFERIREQFRGDSSVHVDDIADAFAALWTAERKLKGQAERIPSAGQKDTHGLAMEIWY